MAGLGFQCDLDFPVCPASPDPGICTVAMGMGDMADNIIMDTTITMVLVMIIGMIMVDLVIRWR